MNQDSVEMLSAVAIKEEKDTLVDSTFDQVLIYPNPVTHQLSIEVNECKDGKVIICNMLGETVVSNQLFLRQKIDMSTFPNGVYIVEVTSSNVRAVKKVIKQ